MSPVYSYTCQECGHIFEMGLPIADRDEPTKGLCQLCDGHNILRDVGCAGFKLEGSGWAKDGYSSTYGDAIKARGKKNGEPLD